MMKKIIKSIVVIYAAVCLAYGVLVSILMLTGILNPKNFLKKVTDLFKKFFKRVKANLRKLYCISKYNEEEDPLNDIYKELYD